MAQEQVIIEFIGDTEKLKNSFNELIQLQTKSAGLNEQQAADFAKANQDMAKSMSGVNAALGDALDKVKSLSDNIKNLGQVIAAGAIKEGIENFKQLSNAVGDTGSKIKTLSEKISTNRKELEAMALAGKEGTKVFKSLLEQTTALENALNHARAVLSTMSNELCGLNAGKELLGGVKSGFEAAAEAAGLLGEKNKDLEEMLKVLTSLAIIYNGVMELANALKKESELRTYAESVATKLLATDKEELTVETEALTTATEEYGAVSEAASALATGGIALAVGAVIGLVYWIKTLASDTDDYKKQLELLNEEYEKQSEALRLISIVSQKLGISNITNEIRQAKLDLDNANNSIKTFGDSIQKEFSKNYPEGRNPFSTKRLADEGKPSREYRDLMTEEQKKTFDQLYKNHVFAEEQMTGLTAEKAKDQIELEEDFEVRSIKIKQNGFNQQLALFAHETEKQKSALKNRLDDELDSQKQKDEYLTAFEQERGKIRAEMVRKQDITTQQEHVNAMLAITQKGSEQEDAWLKQRAATKQKDVLTNPASTDQERSDAHKIYVDEVSKIDDDAAERHKKLLQQQEIDERQSAVTAAQARLTAVRGEMDDELEAKKDLLKQQSALSQAEVENSTASEQAKAAKILLINEQLKQNLEAAEKEYNAKIAAIRKQELDTQLTHADAQNKLVQTNPNASGKEKFDAQQTLYDQQKQNNLDQQEDLKKRYDQDLVSTDDYLSQMTALDDKYNQLYQDQKTAVQKHVEDQLKQYGKVAIDLAKDISDEIFAAENEARNAKYNAEIANIQKISQFQLNNHNLTEAQKAAIQKKYDKQQAAIKLQQWKADQKSKEEQAGINTALAVTNAFATAPWPISIVQAAVAAATGAAQIATIAAQKPPQFAKGTPAGMATTPPGMKLVGEQGPELIYTPGGERIMTAPDTAALLAKYAIPQMPIVPDFKTGDYATGPALPAIDYNKLGKSVADALKANPQTKINMDKDGFTSFIVQKGSKHQYVNNKFTA